MRTRAKVPASVLESAWPVILSQTRFRPFSLLYLTGSSSAFFLFASFFGSATFAFFYQASHFLAAFAAGLSDGHFTRAFALRHGITNN
jgi:hypothetical protein